MIVVVTPDGMREFPDASNFVTEETFNNLCLEDSRERIIAVFAHDKWISVEIK